MRWLVFVLLATQALAHDEGPGSWIGHEGFKSPITKQHCCDGDDCKMTTGVQLTPRGYVLPSGEVFPPDMTLPSQDGKYWRCASSGAPTRCLFVPRPAT